MRKYNFEHNGIVLMVVEMAYMSDGTLEAIKKGLEKQYGMPLKEIKVYQVEKKETFTLID